MKSKRVLLPLLAVVLVLSAGIGAAHAYFTTYAEARGGYQIQLGDETELYERFSQWTKHIQVASVEGSMPVFVRVHVVTDQFHPVTYEPGTGWTDGGDGWWYYSPVLEGGQSTAELQAHILAPEDPEAGDAFDVVVYSQSTPTLYREDGTAYADWNVILDSNPEGGN